MIFITNSSDFEKVFLKHEYDKVILETQFVIVSTRIKKKSNSNKNIVIATNILYPELEFFECETKSDDAKREYYKQLDSNRVFLATVIKGSIKKNFNIIFICSTNEWKNFSYLKYLRDYIIDVFSYPVYNYKKYINGCALYSYDEAYTLKRCNRIISQAKAVSDMKDRSTEAGRERLMKKYKKYSTKKLIKEVKRIGIYYDGMSRENMLDSIECFL